MKVAVLGCGAWGTSLARLFALKGKEVVMYGHLGKGHEDINTIHKNTPVFPDVTLPNNLTFSDDLSFAVADSDILLFSIPSKSYRDLSRTVNPLLKKRVHIISTAKGFDPTSFERLSLVLKEELNPNMIYPIVTLIGPSYAAEVIQDLVTCVTAVSEEEKEAKFVQKELSGPTFRVYTNTDVIGSECSSALKNVLAIGAGMLIGLGEGENARAALVTRGLTEMVRFGIAMGGKKSTFYGLTGIGDLLLTCNSMKSRNFSIGYQIGQSNNAFEVLKSNKTTVEGVYTSKYATMVAKKLKIDMPIVNSIYQILFESAIPSVTLSSLMARELKAE